MESSTVDTDWMQFFCKSGQLLFYYNKVTAEHRWPDTSNGYEHGAPIVERSLVSVGTQTEDNGCSNGCTSIHVYGSSIHLNYADTENNASESSQKGICGKIQFKVENNINRPNVLNIDAGTKPNERSLPQGKTFTYRYKSDSEHPTHNGLKTFQCQICERSFSQLGHLKKHIKITHTKGRPFLCKTCGKSFSDEEILKIHQKVHLTRKYKCKICGKKFYQKGKLQSQVKWQRYFENHLNIHTGTRPYQCKTCKKVFTHLGSLLRHEVLHKSNPDKIRKSTLKPTGNSEKDIEQEKNHSDVSLFTCATCGKSFAAEASLKCHQRIHPNNTTKPHKCKTCGKAFTQKGNLKSHEETHTGEKPYKCTICGKAYLRERYLKVHGQLHTGTKPFECATCGKKFPLKDNLRIHRRTHTNPDTKPHKCRTCGKAFHDTSKLKRHESIHSGLKPYKCEICDKTFADKGYLRSHEIIHSGIKSHECQICGKKFVIKSSLTVHLQAHNGIKRYRCKICGKSFSSKSYLANHENIHAGEKPYECRICGQTFSHHGNCKRHEKNHVE